MKLPSIPAVAPGFDPYNSEIERAIGRITPPDLAPFDGIIPASTMSDSDSAYETPSELLPNARTKNSATRLANPVLISAREIMNAAITSHTDLSAQPISACSTVNPPNSALSVTASRTSAPAGIGCVIDPAMVAMNIPVSRQPSGFTSAGLGMT